MLSKRRELLYGVVGCGGLSLVAMLGMLHFCCLPKFMHSATWVRYGMWFWLGIKLCADILFVIFMKKLSDKVEEEGDGSYD